MAFSLSRPLAVLLLILAAGCGGPTQRPPVASFQAPRAAPGDMFEAGYDYIASRFIEPVPMRQLASRALGGMSDLDPGFDARIGPDAIELSHQGRVIERLAVPADSDLEGWAAVTAASLTRGREVSPALAEADNEAVYEAAFDAMVAGLDDYSRYSSAREAWDNRAQRDGFGGIGVTIRMTDGRLKVLSVFPETPAERGGLIADDIITHVDGRPITGDDETRAVEMLRGPAGSPVVVTVDRAGDIFDTTLTRAHIVPVTVEIRLIDNIGVVRIHYFNQRTARDVFDAVGQLRRKAPGGRLGGVVVDLRDSPGGLLDQAVAIADIFLARGRIISALGRHPHSRQYYDAHPGDLIAGTPMVVLVNGNTASAAEVLAAALQDSGRAVVVGSSSYGKGSVQTVLTMPNEGEITLTWSNLYAPSGYRINHLGIRPTVCTSGLSGEAPVVLNHALARLGDSGRVLEDWRAADDPSDLTAERLRATCPPSLDDRDLDLDVALELLHDRPLHARALDPSPPRVAERP